MQQEFLTFDSCNSVNTIQTFSHGNGIRSHRNAFEWNPTEIVREFSWKMSLD